MSKTSRSESKVRLQVPTDVQGSFLVEPRDDEESEFASKINLIKCSQDDSEDANLPFLHEGNIFDLDNSATDNLNAGTYVPPFNVVSRNNPEINKHNAYLAAFWGNHTFENCPWCDSTKPTTKLKKYWDLELNDTEKQGLLTQRIIATCLTYLVKSPETRQSVYAKCVLSGKNLRNISALKSYHYLQYLDLSFNYVETLEALGEMPFLMYLDASHNELTEVLDFKAPFNLTFVNLSHNNITAIKTLDAFWSIVKMDLSHNKIKKITGLQNLRYLRDLNLSFNEIVCIENLNNMVLETLDLYSNKIYNFGGGNYGAFQTLHRLIHLSLGCNQLDTMEVLKNVHHLQDVDFSNNKVSRLTEIFNLKGLLYLTDLDLRGNPLAKDKNYFKSCMENCTKLLYLDGEYISCESKVLSGMRLDSTYLQAHLVMEEYMLLGHINYPELSSLKNPFKEPPVPIICFIGPLGSLKGMMVEQICEAFPKYTTRGVSYTTRPQGEDEQNGKDYYFVTNAEFTEMHRKGLFYTTTTNFGYLYGFPRSELNKTEDKKSILITHMDLSAGFALRFQGLRPILVLTIPKTEENHREYLKEKYVCKNRSNGIYQVVCSKKESKETDAQCEKLRHQEVRAMVRDILKEIGSHEFGYPFYNIEPKSESSAQPQSNKYKDANGPQGESTLSAFFASSLLDFKSYYDAPIYVPVRTAPDTNLLESNEKKSSEGDLKGNRYVSFSNVMNFAEGEDEAEDDILKTFYSGTTGSDTSRQTEIKSGASDWNVSDMQSVTDHVLAQLLLKEVKNTEIFINNVIASREKYLRRHFEYPGLFSYVIHPDTLDEKECNLLKDMLKSCYERQHNRAPAEKITFNPVDHKVAKSRLENWFQLLKPGKFDSGDQCQ